MNKLGLVRVILENLPITRFLTHISRISFTGNVFAGSGDSDLILGGLLLSLTEWETTVILSVITALKKTTWRVVEMLC